MSLSQYQLHALVERRICRAADFNSHVQRVSPVRKVEHVLFQVIPGCMKKIRNDVAASLSIYPRLFLFQSLDKNRCLHRDLLCFEESAE
jgi:hypothetical protein